MPSIVNVLVVEDEHIVALDLGQRLKRLGYVVVGRAATGEKALLLARDKRPDLIIMDIKLKGEMTGIDAARLIQREQAVPVVSSQLLVTRQRFAKPTMWSFLAMFSNHSRKVSCGSRWKRHFCGST